MSITSVFLSLFCAKQKSYYDFLENEEDIGWWPYKFIEIRDIINKFGYPNKWYWDKYNNCFRCHFPYYYGRDIVTIEENGKTIFKNESNHCKPSKENKATEEENKALTKKFLIWFNIVYPYYERYDKYKQDEKNKITQIREKITRG